MKKHVDWKRVLGTVVYIIVSLLLYFHWLQNGIGRFKLVNDLMPAWGAWFLAFTLPILAVAVLFFAYLFYYHNGEEKKEDE